MSGTRHMRKGAQLHGRRPSLLVLTSTLPRWSGDPEPRFVLDLAKSLREDYHVTILAPQAPGAAAREVMDGVEVRRFRYAPLRMLEQLAAPGAIMSNLRARSSLAVLIPGFFIGQLVALVRLLRRGRYDVVHCHWMIPQGLTVLACSKFMRTPPLLLTCHGTDVYALNSTWIRILKRAILRRADAITVVSRQMAKFLSESFGAHVLDNCEQISMGVDLSLFRRSERQPPIDEYRVLYAGRLSEGKGVRFLLRAFADPRLADPRITLRIAGAGPLRARLEAETAELGLAGRVRFLGALPHEDLAREMAMASIFCLPSISDASGAREGLPTVLLEAAASGLPIIASDVGGSSDFIRAGETGWLVEPGSEDALAEALADAFHHPHLAERMASAVNARVQDFAWPRVAERYARVIERLIARGVAS